MDVYRESRPEDLERIRQLTKDLAARDGSIAKLEGQVAELERKMQRMHGELLLREDNYNKTFTNGGAGVTVLNVSQAMNASQSVMDWMLKPPRPGSRSKR